MRLDDIIELHKRVIHTEWKTVSITDIELEDKWIKKYPYDLLNNVCVDCFTDPDLIDDLLVPESN